ncbi:MAG TPA: hypothetical protein VFH51_17735, partial [Myxococcota bacterium]|nr:hypothetical protein [Myxococcota bacterium]
MITYAPTGEAGPSAGSLPEDAAGKDVLAADRPVAMRLLAVAPVAAHLPPKVTLGAREPAEGTGGALRSINGIPVKRLEAIMRPGFPGPGGSQAGFLGPQQTLQEVLDGDSQWLIQTGHTRQSLAWPLFLAVAAGRQRVDDFLFNNQIIAVEAKNSPRQQQSPFHD